MSVEPAEDDARIVVGVDGSESSKAALAWAVHQAALTGAVVGSRGHAGFTEALLGSVGQHCVHHADCPVVVVRDHHGDGSAQ